MSGATRINYSLVAATLGGWLAVMWGTDVRVAIVITGAMALTLAMRVHAASICGVVVLDSHETVTTCLLRDGHMGSHVDKYGDRRSIS